MADECRRLARIFQQIRRRDGSDGHERSHHPSIQVKITIPNITIRHRLATEQMLSISDGRERAVVGL